jgi:hypothetical protein
MTTCIRPGCFRARHRGGLCNPDYAEASRLGLVGFRPSGPVIEHIERLQSLGWTLDQIAEAAGVGETVPSSVLSRRPEKVRLSTHRGIMSVPLVGRASRRGMDATGTRRRVQALMRLGWSTEVVAGRLGTTRKSLMTTMTKPCVSYRFAYKVATLYRELGGEPGPSARARIYAESRGYPSPAAWSDGAIDDPRATPNFTGYDEDRVQAYMTGERPADLTKADRVEAAVRLVNDGLTPLEAARVLGTTAVYVQSWLGADAA